MRVIQMIHELSSGTGVGNAIMSVKKILDRSNIINYIYTLKLNGIEETDRIIEASGLETVPVNEDDVLIYHFAIGSELNNKILSINAKKILVYQNVTPPEFFAEWDYNTYTACIQGRYEASITACGYNRAICMSKYNKNELVSFGFEESKIDVIPIISLTQFKTEPNKKIIETYKADGYLNILFTGRKAPNKKIEDIVESFAYYNKNVNPKSRLILVGGLAVKNYINAIRKYIAENDIQNVVFTGQVPDDEWEAYYKIADVFLCLSEHEGFCIPLLEAMQRDVCVVAYDCTAIPDTMGGAGVLLKDKSPASVAAAIDRIVKDKTYKEEILKGQRKRVSEFNIDSYADKVCESIYKAAEDKAVCIKEKNTFLDTGDDDNKKGLKHLLNEKYVVYGLGKVGKSVVKKVQEIKDENLVAICDNNYPDRKYKGYEVCEHEECISKYKDVKYVITVQAHFLDIMRSLMDSGVDFDSLYFYDEARGEILGRSI